MRALAAILLAGCSFDIPREPSAHAECLRYAASLDAKMVECGDPQDKQDSLNMRIFAHCDRTALVNPLGESVDSCIVGVMRVDCAERDAVKWCGAFVER